VGFGIADGEAALRFSMVDFERASLDEEVVAKTAPLPELSRCEPSALSPDAAAFSRGIPSVVETLTVGKAHFSKSARSGAPATST
jgi:hypothetical protein